MIRHETLDQLKQLACFGPLEGQALRLALDLFVMGRAH